MFNNYALIKPEHGHAIGSSVSRTQMMVCNKTLVHFKYQPVEPVLFQDHEGTVKVFRAQSVLFAFKT